MPLVCANEKPETRTELMGLQGPQTELTPEQQPVTRRVPEPNVLATLAFAGFVILTRHRFRS